LADPSEIPHHLFIVRVWVDPARPEPSVARGQIEHVSSGERRYFRELDEIQAFVADSLSSPPYAQEQSLDAF